MSKLPFSKKLFLSFTALIMLIIVIAVVIFSIYFYNDLLRKSKQSLSDLSEKTSQTLDNLLTDMDKLALYISSNPEVRQSFWEAYYYERTSLELEADIINTLTSITVPNSASKFRISLYNPKGNFVSTGIAYTRSVVNTFLASENYQSWYSSLPIINSHRSFSQIYTDHLTDDGTQMISLYREITDPQNIRNVIGIIDVQCPYEYLEDLLALDNDSYKCALFDRSGQLLFSDIEDVEPDTFFQNADFENSSVVSATCQNYIYTAIHSNFSGFTLITVQSVADIMSVLLSFMAILTAIVLLLIGFSLCLIFIITRKLTVPLRELSESVNRVSISNLSLSIHTDDTIDEFKQLNQAFQLMFSRLHDSMNEIVTMKSHELHAHMIALQAQMNPHFLYNILAVIKSLSHQQDSETISATCDYLTSMLRYSTSYKDTRVPLDSEIKHVKDYLSLMKIRYQSMLEYRIELSSEILNTSVMIPKLSLQPIVENCFQHGFKNKLPPWEICIHGWICAENWFISVTDNGTGFSQESLDILNARVDDFLRNPSDNLDTLHFGGMGLVDTIVRLKLRYKDSAIFRVEDLSSGGTRITIGGTYYDENFIS